MTTTQQSNKGFQKVETVDVALTLSLYLRIKPPSSASGQSLLTVVGKHKSEDTKVK